MDSCGFHWNDWIPAGFHRNSTGFHRNSTGMTGFLQDSCRNRWGTVKYWTRSFRQVEVVLWGWWWWKAGEQELQGGGTSDTDVNEEPQSFLQLHAHAVHSAHIVSTFQLGHSNLNIALGIPGLDIFPTSTMLRPLAKFSLSFLELSMSRSVEYGSISVSPRHTTGCDEI